MTIGQQVSMRREKLGLTQQQVADRVGICLAHVSLIEADKRDPSLRVLNRIADAVGAKVFIVWERA